MYFLVYCFFLYYVCFYLRVNKDEYNNVGNVIEATIDRVSVFYEFKKNKIHEIDWILKMLTEFYFKIQYFNFDWEITITLLHSYRNTQQWQVRFKSVLSRVRISNSPLFQFNCYFNVVHSPNVLQFNHKTYQQSPKYSVHELHTLTVGPTWRHCPCG